MKILVLNGSPKRDKSDTMHITRAFLNGMKEAAPQDIHIIHTIDQHIEYCTGCFSCMRNGGSCIHNDDMKAILEEILDSDLLLFNFPLYCYGMPASLKALMDRTLPLSNMAMQKIAVQNLLQNRFHIVIMDAGAAVSHTGKAASAVFNVLIDGMDDVYILRCRFLHAVQKCTGDVHRIAIIPLGAPVQNKYLHWLILPKAFSISQPI